MIQLVFDASTRGAGAEQDPVEVGYSQHEGAERAAWDDDKLELVDGTHPVVYPAAGSHANNSRRRSTSAARPRPASAATTRAGRTSSPPGRADDPERPGRSARARSRGSPSRAAGASSSRRSSTGRPGPNLKTQWTEPIDWSEGWRDRSYAVPAGGVFGTGATDFFCGAVATGLDARSSGSSMSPRRRSASCSRRSSLLARARDSRATWRPAAPLRLAAGAAGARSSPASGAHVRPAEPALPRHRPAASSRSRCCHAAPGARPRSGFELLGIQTGGESGGLARAPRRRDRDGADAARPRARAGRDSPARSSRSTQAGRSGRSAPTGSPSTAIRPLLGALLVACVVVSLLASSLFLIPIAIWLAVRWALIAPVVELEERSGDRRASPQRPARPWALAQGRLARRRRRRARARRRARSLGALLIFVDRRAALRC